jgi:hypothetical protein
MSCETLRPLPLLVIVEALGRGFLAALMFPSGVEDGVMLAVVSPDVETVRMVGRGGSRAVGLSEAGGGDSRGLSESKSSSGVEAVDAIAIDVRIGCRWQACCKQPKLGRLAELGSDNSSRSSTRVKADCRKDGLAKRSGQSC